jgi:hypothetical protein
MIRHRDFFELILARFLEGVSVRNIVEWRYVIRREAC